MIPDAAVEAARDVVERITGDKLLGGAADEFARLALEAAAPHMRQSRIASWLGIRRGTRGKTAQCKWTSGCPKINGHPGECTGSLVGL